MVVYDCPTGEAGWLRGYARRFRGTAQAVESCYLCCHAEAINGYLEGEGSRLCQILIYLFFSTSCFCYLVCPSDLVTRHLCSVRFLLPSPPRKQGVPSVWLRVPQSLLHLCGSTLSNGFELHHAKKGFVMFSAWLKDDGPVMLPPYAHYQIGAAGLVRSCMHVQRI